MQVFAVEVEVVITFCPGCWLEISNQTLTCPHCGADQSQISAEPFVKKLIRALHHPEPETPIRAAYVLGQLKAVEAVPALLVVVAEQSDQFIVAACIDALAEIGDTSLSGPLEQLLRSVPGLIVEDALEKALVKLRTQKPTMEESS